MPRTPDCLTSMLAGIAFLSSYAPAQTLTTSVVASSFSRPIFVTAPPGDSDRLFVCEQHSGRIEIIMGGTTVVTPFLDLDGLATGNEQGLLGLAFHPNFAANGRFYVNYIVSGGSGTTRIVEHTVTAGPPLTTHVADAATANTVMQFSQPFVNHNAGMLAFGPDGFLYIATGDGGAAGDPGDRSQNPNSIHGKMLRIDIDGDDFPGDSLRDYAIPPGNPSFGGLPELWMIGLRNPWRFSFDPDTGNMWIGDVGQGSREEVNVDIGGGGGQNWGWRCREGFSCNIDSAYCTCGTSTLVDPVIDYSHGIGLAIMGGYVYRGSAFPCLDGLYFYSDYATGRTWTAELDGISATATERTNEIGTLSGITSYGTDDAGNLYLCQQDGTIRRIEVDDGCPSMVSEACQGDGGDQMGCTDCPCMNNAPPGSRGGCLHSVGSSARLLHSGSASVTNDTFQMQVESALPGSFAILTSGAALAPASMASPCFGLDSGLAQPAYQDGLRCVLQGVLRHGSRALNNTGSTSTGWGGSLPPTGGIIADGGFLVGTYRYWQAIYRDVPGVCGAGQNTTQALSTEIVP